MKIFTLYVNKFNGDENTKTNKFDNLKELEKEIDKILINDKESVIILHGVPYMGRNNYSNWKETEIFKEFYKTFNDKYKVVLPKELHPALICTVAICAKDSEWKEPDSDSKIINYSGTGLNNRDYRNRFIELQIKLQNDKYTLLGVHMTPKDDMWELILNSEKQETKHDLIVGNFAANEKRGIMKNKPQELRKLGYDTCIINKNTYFYNQNGSALSTSIDNIYYKKAKEKLTPKNPQVTRPNNFKTNHALCSVEIN